MRWLPRVQHFELAATLAVLLASSAGCSLVLDKQSDQCSTDADCEHFGGHPYCNSGYCVASGLGPENCVLGTPTKQSDYLNACSTSKCVAFDNCDRLGLCSGQTLPPLVDPTNTTIPPLTNTPPKPTINCTDGLKVGQGMIYLFGSSDFAPLLRAAQPSLSALPNPYRAVFQNATSCAGADSIFSADTTKHVIHDPTGTASNWAFYFDDNSVQQNCLLDPAGNTVDIGISDLYAQTCDPTYVPGSTSQVAEYTGPVVPFVLSVRQTSPQQSISAEAAHIVFGDRGMVPATSGMKNAAPWTDPNSYFIRSGTAGSTVLTALLIDVPKSKFWGIDRLSTDNLRDSLLASTSVEPSIGILSIDYNDKNRGNLKSLYLQSKDQLCGYQPDSQPTTYDKANVRDGHYPLWGYVHFFTKIGSGGVPSAAANAMVLLFNVQKLNQALLDDVIAASLTPQCAMKVSRMAEIGDFSARAGVQCGCYFDFKTTGKTTCQTCSTSEDCPGKHPCNYGYCEINEND